MYTNLFPILYSFTIDSSRTCSPTLSRHSIYIIFICLYISLLNLAFSFFNCVVAGRRQHSNKFMIAGSQHWGSPHQITLSEILLHPEMSLETSLWHLLVHTASLVLTNIMPITFFSSFKKNLCTNLWQPQKNNNTSTVTPTPSYLFFILCACLF